MRNAALVPLVVICLAGCDRPPAAPRVTVDDAVVTLPAAPGRPGAAYFVLRTNIDPSRLVGIASPRVGRIELHETIDAGGMSRMAPLREATFSPDAPLVFAPGRRHAMLFDIDAAARAGTTIALTIRVDPAPPVTVEAQVRAPGDVGHAGHQGR
jgi:copper(I)-binding protein